MKLFSTLAAVAAVVTAQGPDGGVAVAPQPPQRPAAVASTSDAGAPAPAAAPQQPAVTRVVTVDNSAEVAQVKTELKAQNEKLEAAVRELQQLRADLATKQQAEQQRLEQADSQKQAATAMRSLDQQLSTGDTGIEQTLSNIEGSLGPSAQQNLAHARAALANSDLTNARYYLARAAADAQAGR